MTERNQDREKLNLAKVYQSLVEAGRVKAAR
jgi:hypothetical protein